MLRSKFGGNEFILILAAIVRTSCQWIDSDSMFDAAAYELAKKIAPAAADFDDRVPGQTIALHPIAGEFFCKLTEVCRRCLRAFILRADGAEHWVEGTIENQSATLARYELNRPFRKIFGLSGGGEDRCAS